MSSSMLIFREVSSNERATATVPSTARREVTLDLLFQEQIEHLVREDDPVELFDGNRLIARGGALPSARNAQ